MFVHFGRGGGRQKWAREMGMGVESSKSEVLEA